MGFFKYNTTNEDGRGYLYQEFPTYFTWKKNERKWQARKKGFAVGKIFFLCLLLTVVRGHTSFQDLRTVNGVVFDTFREECQALHLIEDDQEWFKCFPKAVVFVSGSSLRSLLISALLFQELNQPAALWNEFCLSICDDLDVRMRQLGFTDQLN
ncbi:hypothetical protein A0J61_10827, partial [Choanephora cucurbitarum]